MNLAFVSCLSNNCSILLPTSSTTLSEFWVCIVIMRSPSSPGRCRLLNLHHAAPNHQIVPVHLITYRVALLHLTLEGLGRDLLDLHTGGLVLVMISFAWSHVAWSVVTAIVLRHEPFIKLYIHIDTKDRQLQTAHLYALKLLTSDGQRCVFFAFSRAAASQFSCCSCWWRSHGSPSWVGKLVWALRSLITMLEVHCHTRLITALAR